MYKQQHNVGFLIFDFTLNYMLGNVYNNIHAKQWGVFSHAFNFFVVSKGIFHGEFENS